MSASSVRLLIFFTVIPIYFSSLHSRWRSLIRQNAPIDNIVRQYTLHALFAPPALGSVFDGAAELERESISVLTPAKHTRSCPIVVPAGWAGKKSLVVRGSFDVNA